ncbi:MAG: HAD-IIB family hydrolase [Bryobacterales bacterium]|jgi:mannosyl-3-phosphoglycerate phosphatase|nr:HAD-IIB family hydrolase [Bryobacterales bacterium]
MWIVVTDLDGTLLNHSDYRWEAAREALETLKDRGIPVILCTSKTAAEVRILRRDMGNQHPYIVENGGGAYFPASSFGNLAADLPRRDQELRLDLGAPYHQLVTALHDAASETGCAVRGFADATDEQVAAWCGFGPDTARLARQREFDEPFLLESGDPAALEAAIRRRGFRTTQGGRFWHILGNNDKGAALRAVRRAYLACGVPVTVAALGDSPNDLPLLEQAEWPVWMPSPRLDKLRRMLPHARVAPAPGAAGWGAAVLQAIPVWLQGQASSPLQQFAF